MPSRLLKYLSRCAATQPRTRCGVGFFAHSYGYGLQNPPCPVSDLHDCPATDGIAAALAALRWHGYRSENRYMVFQCLSHTLGWPVNQWRVLDAAHQKRNLAEYEGYLEVQDTFVVELCELVQYLIDDVQKLLQNSQ